MRIFLVSDVDLQVVCMDLFEGGMDTVSNSSVFMILHVIRNDEVQKKLHNEIDQIIGPLRPPTLNDRNRCRYIFKRFLENLLLPKLMRQF